MGETQESNCPQVPNTCFGGNQTQRLHHQRTRSGSRSLGTGMVSSQSNGRRRLSQERRVQSMDIAQARQALVSRGQGVVDPAAGRLKHFLFVDAETFYSKDYTLRRLT